MDNEGFKEILSEVGMTKKGFAKKVGLAYQTVAGWTNQGYPVWIDSYANMMIELHRCMAPGKTIYAKANLIPPGETIEKILASPTEIRIGYKEEKQSIERLEAEVKKVREEFSKELNELKKRINLLNTPDNS